MVSTCGTAKGDAINLHFAVDDHTGNDTGTRRGVLSKILAKHLVEGREVASVFQPDSAAHYVLDAVSSLMEDCDQIFDGLIALDKNVAGDKFAMQHGHLTGNIEPAIGLDCAREWEVLSARALAAFRAITFHLWSRSWEWYGMFA